METRWTGSETRAGGRGGAEEGTQAESMTCVMGLRSTESRNASRGTGSETRAGGSGGAEEGHRPRA